MPKGISAPRRTTREKRGYMGSCTGVYLVVPRHVSLVRQTSKEKALSAKM